MSQSFFIFDEPDERKRLSEMIFVEGGTFSMGSKDDDEDVLDREKPAHDVTLDSFHIGKYPVTVQQYLQFVDETKTHYPEWLEEGSDYNINTGNDHQYRRLGDTLQNPTNPIVGISWDDATAYCAWLSNKTGQSFKLPTEAQWEYAAKGGKYYADFPFTYSGSNKLNKVGWYDDNSHKEIKPVGLKMPNFLGIHDMSGNVWEWCNDWYGSYEDVIKQSKKDTKTGAIVNPIDVEKSTDRVLRGGSQRDLALYCRSSYRFNYTPLYRYYDIGFRLVLVTPSV